MGDWDKHINFFFSKVDLDLMCFEGALRPSVLTYTVSVITAIALL